MTWQPIETLPKENCVVVFFHANEPFDMLPDDQFSTGYFEACNAETVTGFRCCDGGFDWDDGMTPPTHWLCIGSERYGQHADPPSVEQPA